MAEPQYQAVHLTRVDAEIFATRVGREIGPKYLMDDTRDYWRMKVLMRLQLLSARQAAYREWEATQP